MYLLLLTEISVIIIRKNTKWGINMKLAEALQERADLNVKIEQLRNRLSNNALVQEGETTAENPTELLTELDGAIERLRELMARINKTNCMTEKDGSTITEMIARRDALSVKIRAYRDLAAIASGTARRAMHTEIKVMSAVNVRDIQKKIDEMSKELRLTDNSIQELNWQTELI